MLDATPADLIRAAKEFGFEGIVAKRKTSLYESGKRSGAWLKYRINKGQEFVIGGYVPDNPFESRWADGKTDRLLEFAAEFVRLKVERTSAWLLKTRLQQSLLFLRP